MTVSQELIPGVRCVVTHPSKNGEFKKGDVIWLDVDGAIMNNTIKAWMAAEDVPAATEGMEVKSANPVVQELREWATKISFPLFLQLSFEAWAEMMKAASSSTEWGPYMDNMHRRTFALFVACALEDEE